MDKDNQMIFQIMPPGVLPESGTEIWKIAAKFPFVMAVTTLPNKQAANGYYRTANLQVWICGISEEVNTPSKRDDTYIWLYSFWA